MSLTFSPAHDAFIQIIAQQAEALSLNAFLVGGIVRDKLLQRDNHDMDFVIEGNAIRFVHHLAKHYGGTVTAFAPFGTAKWHLDETCAQTLAIAQEDLPHSVDFAMARSEFYAHPTALPTVQASSIQEDLKRRDFTINAIAMQISPITAFGRLVDVYNGLQDLSNGLVRVLHDQSFIDDPTRIIRAVRFAERFDFTIEAQTLRLLQEAHPMLGRITGERLYNEFNILFSEPLPEKSIQRIHTLGIDTAIHPLFVIHPTIPTFFQKLRLPYPQWSDDKLALQWNLLLATLPIEHIPPIAERLLMPATYSRIAYHTADLWTDTHWQHPHTKISDIVARLETAPLVSLVAIWIMSDQPFLRERLAYFVNEWQHIKPKTNGKTLLAMGLPPSPEFSRILTALRQAWLDKIIHNEAQEKNLLADLLKDVRHDHP